MATGLFYDLLRCVRYRVRGRIFCALLDLLFWCAVTAALFLWSVAAGRGVVRFSVCAALFLGAAAYLHFFSPVCFPLLSTLTGLLIRLARLLGAPFRAAGGCAEMRKKIYPFFQKTLFISRK